MSIIHIYQKPSKRKINPRLASLNAKHQEYIDSILKDRKRTRPNLVKRPVAISNIQLSNSIPGPTFKKSIDDYKWKRDREETEKTILEIERKKTRIAPAFNKGNYTYISDATDPTTLGRKI